MRNLKIIEDLKILLRRIAPGAKAILFGSQARGEARADSDIDILVLLDTDSVNLEEETRITDELYDFEYNNGIIVSPIIMSVKAWEKLKDRTILYHEIHKYGLDLL